MRPLLAAVLVSLAIPALRAQDNSARHDTGLQLAPRKAAVEAPPARVPAWRAPFAAAEAAARERHVLLLLYFTAKW